MRTHPPAPAPFYIARTSGSYVQALGLEPYALVQGLAYKIEPAVIASSRDTVALSGMGHVDVPRTRALWDSHGAPRAFVARGDWVDRPSIGIPALYISTAFQLAQLMLDRGDTPAAERYRRAALDMGEATHTLDLFLPRAQ